MLAGPVCGYKTNGIGGVWDGREQFNLVLHGLSSLSLGAL